MQTSQSSSHLHPVLPAQTLNHRLELGSLIKHAQQTACVQEQHRPPLPGVWLPPHVLDELVQGLAGVHRVQHNACSTQSSFYLGLGSLFYIMHAANLSLCPVHLRLEAGSMTAAETICSAETECCSRCMVWACSLWAEAQKVQGGLLCAPVSCATVCMNSSSSVRLMAYPAPFPCKTVTMSCDLAPADT